MISDPSSSEPASQQSQAESLGLDGQEVREIKFEYVYEDMNEMTYKVSWKGANCDDSWVPALEIADIAPDLLASWNSGVRPAVAPDAEAGPVLVDADMADPLAGNPFWSNFQRGYWSLVRQSRPEMKEHSALPDTMNIDIFKEQAIEVLASIPWLLLSSVCGASVQRRRYLDPVLDDHLESNLRDSSKQPGIYMYEFCDFHGMSPTVTLMKHCIHRTRQYANPTNGEDNEWAVPVDDQFASYKMSHADRQSIMDGARRYFPTPLSRERTLKMLEALEAQMTGLADDDVVPFVLRDVGYASNCKKRIVEQHDAHKSTNSIMGLFEAISLADDQMDGVYRNRSAVIFLCLRIEHAALGEALFSVLGRSYTWHGRGFNSRQAGLNVLGLDNWNDLNVWNKFIMTALPAINLNMQAEKARIDSYREKQQGLEQRIRTAGQDLKQALEGELEAAEVTINLRDEVVKMYQQLRLQ